MSSPDRRYLGQLVAARTGLSQQESEQRVDAVVLQGDGKVGTLFTALYSRVMVSSPDFGNSLTVPGTASAHYTLAVMTVAAAIVAPLVLLYQGWTYYVFRARITGEEVASPVDALTQRPSGAHGA